MVLVYSSCGDDPVIPEPDPGDKPGTDTKPDPFENVLVAPKEFEIAETYWWPEQKIAEKIITCQVDGNNHKERILSESLAGIAAKAVNEGKNDELIWVSVSTPALNEWFNRTIARLSPKSSQTMDVWQLLEHLTSRGLVKGYVVYDYDTSVGGMYTPRNGMDISANIATSVAGVSNAALIDRSMESRMIDVGLVNIFDAAGDYTYRDVYDHLKTAINHNLIMMVDPKAPHHREIAMAHNAMVFDASSNPDMDYFFGKMKVSSPLLGWGFGDEFNFTSRASNKGVIATASNWCWNLSFLSAGSREYQTKKVKSLHPKDVDWEKEGHFHSFLMSDGDNLQWMELNFTHHTDYWANSNHGNFPFAWGTCAGQLSEMLPVVIDYMAETQAQNTSIIEFGGGYHYPDLFGSKTNRELAIRTHAKKVNEHMKRNGVKVFGFICSDVDSYEAKQAYQVYAEEIEDLSGMVAIQYAPYEGGNGETFWATTTNGVHIPVVTAKYALWANLNNPRAGGPDKIATLINSEVENANAAQKVANSWTIVHAWSEFPNEDGLTARGLTPVKWTVDKLSETVTVVNTEEMLWRVRMENYPDEVQQIINGQ